MEILRYRPTLRFARRADPDRFAAGYAPGRPETPCSLLIPPELLEGFESMLAHYRCSPGIYLRMLMETYRTVCLQHGPPQAGGIKRRYQAAGTRPIKRCFRVENEVWLELGAIASFLGISRCLLFVYLLKLDLAGGSASFAGVPTNPLEGYDRYNPRFIEYRERVYIRQNFYERTLRSRPRTYEQLPPSMQWEHYKLRRRPQTRQT